MDDQIHQQALASTLLSAPAEEGATGARAKRLAVLRERHRRYEAELELAKDAAQFEGQGAFAEVEVVKKCVF